MMIRIIKITLASLTVAALLLTPVLDANAKKKKGPKPGKDPMLEYDQNATPNSIFGTDNTNGFFTAGRKNGVEVALRAKTRFVTPANPDGSHSNADGTYTFSAGDACYFNTSTASITSFDWQPYPLCLTTPVWNYEWSVNTDYDGLNPSRKVSAFVYELGLDADPSSKTDFTVFDNISPTLVTPAYDHSMGDNGTAISAGVEATSIAEYLDNMDLYNVAQNSWNYELDNNHGTSLEHFDPSVPGEYTIYLKVKEPGNKGKTVAESRITVLVNAAGSTPIESSTPIGTITEDIYLGGIPPGSDRGVESAAVNLVADAQKWATAINGAEIAFMNPGGVRSDLIYLESDGEGDGVVTFGEAFSFQPFGNNLQTFLMSGDQIISVLEEQCQPSGSSRPVLHLGVSEGFTYDFSQTTVAGDCVSVTVSNVVVNGVPLSPTGAYMVTVNSFLADGGDNFSTFAEIPPSMRLDGGSDVQALVDYFGMFSPVAPPSTDRVNEN